MKLLFFILLAVPFSVSAQISLDFEPDLPLVYLNTQDSMTAQSKNVKGEMHVLKVNGDTSYTGRVEVRTRGKSS